MDNIWNEIHSQRVWGEYPTESIIRFIARNYYKMERDKVKILDFGCGAGANAWFLAREGFDTYAFDGSEFAIQNATNKLEKEKLSANFSIHDIKEQFYENDLFDAVIDNVCIYANEIKTIQMAYKNIFNVLKKGGLLITVCFGKKTTGYGMGRLVEKDTYTDIIKGPLQDRGVAHFYLNFQNN